MNKNNPYISYLLAIVIVFGVTISATHIHIDDFADVETANVLVEDELFCAICGSVFKFTPADGTVTMLRDCPETSFYAVDTEAAISPYNRFQEGRSPPFFS